MQDAASSAVGAVQQAPDAIVRQTQGNPLAAGLIAFGVGWLVVEPAARPPEKEKQLAQQAETAVRENKDTLLEPAKQAAQEIGEQLKPAAQEAVESVKATAQDAAPPSRKRASRPSQDVQGQAQAVQGQGAEPVGHELDDVHDVLILLPCDPPHPLRPAGTSRRGAVLSGRSPEGVSVRRPQAAGPGPARRCPR